MKEHMTAFGVPIISRIEGGTLKELQESIEKKLSEINIERFPSLMEGAGEQAG